MTDIDVPCHSLFSNIQHRCNRLLLKTSLQNSGYSKATILWMIRKLDPRRYTPCLPFICNKEPEDDDFTTASLLYNNMNSFNLDDGRNLSWSEYFSFLSLIIIEQGTYFNNHLKQHGRSDFHEILYFAMECYIVEAMEAIIISEMLANDPCHCCNSILLPSNKVYSLKNARKSIEKFRYQNDLQSNLIHFWKNEKFSNRTDAARCYYEKMGSAEAFPSKDKAIRKLTGAITDYENAINGIIKSLKKNLS